MKKFFILTTVLCSLTLFATDGETLAKKCIACHGIDFDKKALGKSDIIKGQSEEKIENNLLAYQNGSLNQYGMGMLMKGQLTSLSPEDIKLLANFIADKK